MSDLGADPARPAPAPDSAGSAFDRLARLDAENDPDGADDLPLDVGSARVAVNAPQLTRRGRLRKWDRPPQPKDWRWWVGNLGKTLITAGLLMFGFVAYQLWGTGIETARAQNQLESEFDALLADSPAVDAPIFAPGDSDTTGPATTIADTGTDETEPTPDEPAADPTTPVTTLAPVPAAQQVIPELEDGDALARLEIPAIGRNDIVVAGVSTADLKRGPGHFPDTPLPGQLGNAAIAGHRTTYGEPFGDVDKLQVGDEIIATTLNGTFTYRVTGQQIVESNEYWVVATADPTKATLTLTSCHPKYSAKRRIVIFSELVASESAPVGEAVINYGREPEPADDEVETAAELPGSDDAAATDGADPADETDAPTLTDGGVTGNVDDVAVAAVPLGADDVSDEIVDAFSDGWFSDPGANAQVGLWGALLALVGLGAYLISRKLRRDWAGALIGLLPFVVTLYFFFQNVNRLLPPNL